MAADVGQRFIHDGIRHRETLWLTAIDGTLIELAPDMRECQGIDAFAGGHYGCCRGLAVSDAHLAVGLTEVRPGRLPRHRWADRNPHGSETSVLLLDRQDGTILAVDGWYWLLDNTRSPILEIELPSGTHFRGPVDTVEGKHAWIDGEPRAAFLSASKRVQKAMLTSLAQSAGVSIPVDLPGQLYMRRSDWADLTSCGHIVGAHSASHPRLTELDDIELRKEVQDSIAAVGGTGPFAYPDGDLDDRVAQAVRDGGGTSAVTCEAGTLCHGADPLRLPRVFVHPGLLR